MRGREGTDPRADNWGLYVSFYLQVRMCLWGEELIPGISSFYSLRLI